MMLDLNLTLHKNIALPANYGAKRALTAIKWIVVHYTANDGDTDEGNGKYLLPGIARPPDWHLNAAAATATA